MDYRDLKEAARGNWQYIHAAAGIPRQYLKNKHGACPICGGKDRFRYDDKQGAGTFYCNHCGSGSGFQLIMLWLQCDYREAAKQIEAILGISNGSIEPRRERSTPPKPYEPPPEKDKLAKIQTALNKAIPINKPLSDGSENPAAAYFKSRGLSLPEMPQNISAAITDYWYTSGSKPEKLGSAWTVLAAVTDTSGAICGLHKTYIEQEQTEPCQWRKLKRCFKGEALPSKKMTARKSGSLNGGSVKLFPIQGGRLMIAEGIETALAARELFSDGKSYGLEAALSANGIARLELPPDLNELLIIADHDAPRPVGMNAALSLRERIKRQLPQCTVKIWQPPETGQDALDYLNGQRKSRPKQAAEMERNLHTQTNHLDREILP